MLTKKNSYNFQNNEYIYFGGDDMIFKSGQVGCYGAYDYVKGMLPQIGNIKEFEVYFEDTDPYYEIVNGRKEYYNLIIRDDKENEYWLDSNCGYEGVGPSYSEKILQLLGVRKSYYLNDRRIVKEYNIQPNYSANLLVVSDVYYDENGKSAVYFYLPCRFNNAYERFKTLETLKCFGSITPLSKEEEYFGSYFQDDMIEDESSGENRVNLIYSLSSSLHNFDKRNIRSILTLAIENNNGSFEFFNFKKKY
jgi:hypothetical protein